MNFQEIVDRFRFYRDRRMETTITKIVVTRPVLLYSLYFVIVVAYYEAIAIIKKSFPVDKDLFINKPTSHNWLKCYFHEPEWPLQKRGRDSVPARGS